MAKTPPTDIGDVLILLPREPVTTFAVGAVVREGQADFHQADEVAHVATIILAVQAATVLLRPTGRIYLMDLDAGEWSELPAGLASATRVTGQPSAR